MGNQEGEEDTERKGTFIKQGQTAGKEASGKRGTWEMSALTKENGGKRLNALLETIGGEFGVSD